jgi:HSP20 family protein
MANRKISPDICAYYDEDDEKLKIEVELPGVKKKDITFKLREDSFYIRALKEDYEYIGSYSVCCPVVPDEAEAKYTDGLLTVSVPYREPFEEAVTVQIK